MMRRAMQMGNEVTHLGRDNRAAANNGSYSQGQAVFFDWYNHQELCRQRMPGNLLRHQTNKISGCNN